MATLAHHLQEAGWVVPYLLAAFVLLVGLSIERLIALARAAGPTAELGERLRDLISEGELDAATSTAAANPGSFARVALRILREGMSEAPRQESAAAEALVQEVPLLERRLWLLKLVGSVGVLLGLLGTITGLVSPAWPSVPNHDVSSKAVMLAKAISESMNATLGGLIVAVASLALAFLVSRLVQRHVDRLRAETQSLLCALTAHRGRLRLRLGGEVRRVPVEALGYRQ